MDLENLAPTSNTIRLHILSAYFQSYLWYQSPFQKSINLNPIEYGYHLEDEFLQPTIELEHYRLPEDFPTPCKCLKCARETICPCRVPKLGCCRLCK